MSNPFHILYCVLVSNVYPLHIHFISCTAFCKLGTANSLYYITIIILFLSFLLSNKYLILCTINILPSSVPASSSLNSNLRAELELISNYPHHPPTQPPNHPQKSSGNNSASTQETEILHGNFIQPN